MKQSLILLSLFSLAVAAGIRDFSKTTLEDIERDYITTLKRTKLTPPPVPKIPSKSPTQFGFVPTKTLTNYLQKEPKANYDLQFQLGNLQQYLGGNQYSGAQQESQGQQYDPIQQYAQGQQYIDAAPQKYIAASSLGGTQYNGQAKKPAVQAYYVPQAQGHYQNFENLQFIADNNILQQATQQQASHNPQYVYLQQYQAPSSAVQTVVDPKGPPQYIMYLPTQPAPSAEQSQSYENLVYNGDEQAAYQLPQGPSTYNTVQYSQKEETSQNVHPKNQFTKAEFVLKREPKSLLDSYVPSALQLQYFRQAYQNAIQDGQSLGKHHKQSYRTLGTESFGSFGSRPSSFKH